MDRFREMETFLAVVEAGSFVAAAEKLRISKSAVSRIVQDLERRLGGRLLNRTTRRLSLTDVGQAFYQRCRHILEGIEVARQYRPDLMLLDLGMPRLNGFETARRIRAEVLHRPRAGRGSNPAGVR